MIYLLLLSLEIIFLYLLMMTLLQKLYRKLGTWFFGILVLPGTFFHEISHFLTALFLLVPVGNIELMPQRQGDSVKMGSVPIGKTDPIRRTLIGIAPVIFGLGVLFVTTPLTIPIWVHGFIAFEVGNTMFSSKKDLEGSWILIFLIPLVFILKIDWSILQKVDVFLVIPIGIDIIGILIFNMLK